MSVQQQVYDALTEMGIDFDSVRHAAAFRMEECIEATRGLNAVNVKNFFLCPHNRSRFYLLITRPDAKLRTKDISAQAGSSRLSFAPEADLERCLNEHPGAISPMGLLFDRAHEVTLLVDDALLQAERLAFHPCVNTESLALSADDFFRVFLKGLGYAPVPVIIHDFLDMGAVPPVRQHDEEENS